jgi:hypothetical protein
VRFGGSGCDCLACSTEKTVKDLVHWAEYAMPKRAQTSDRHLGLPVPSDRGRPYFEIMFDADLERFDRLFAPSAMLHGLRAVRCASFQQPSTEAC